MNEIVRYGYLRHPEVARSQCHSSRLGVVEGFIVHAHGRRDRASLESVNATGPVHHHMGQQLVLSEAFLHALCGSRAKVSTIGILKQVDP